jgi:hypothetical protein
MMTSTPTRHSSPRPSPANERRSVSRTVVRVGVFAMVGGVIAALIWMKLKVVGGVPRTAYADPEQERPAQAVQPATHERQATGSASPSPEP